MKTQLSSKWTSRSQRPTRFFFLLAALLASLPGLAPVAETPTTLDDLAWLAGSWAGTKDGVRSEENWTAPAGKMMLAVHRDTRGAGRGFFEYLRIEETDTGVVFMASPGGKPPTPFPLSEAGETHVVFANPEHDFPQRITYRRDGDELFVEATGSGKALNWTWSLQTACSRSD